MSDRHYVEFDKPKYPIGALVVALINSQLRRAKIESAYLQMNIVEDDTGVYIEGALRWEYLVLVINDPIEASEKMVITEHTILREITDTSSDNRNI